MNCYFHPEEVSVATCVDCAKGLCKACAAKYPISICDDCNQRRNEADKKAAIKRVIPSIILFIIGFVGGFILMSTEPMSIRVPCGILMGWALAGVVWGYFATRKWFPPKVYVTPSTGLNAESFFRSARPLVRIFLSVIIGLVAMPVEIVKLIISLSKAKKVSQTINDNRSANG